MSQRLHYFSAMHPAKIYLWKLFRRSATNRVHTRC